MYKPGQIITVPEARKQYRIVKPKRFHCLDCDLAIEPYGLELCDRYCYRRPGNNNFDKYPKGYILKRFRRL